MFMMEEDLGSPMKLGFQLFMPHLPLGPVSDPGDPKTTKGSPKGREQFYQRGPFILKVASSALLSLAPGYLAEPKDKGNRALLLMAPPGMEGRSGLEGPGRGSFEAGQRGDREAVSPGGLVLSLPQSLPPSLP